MKKRMLILALFAVFCCLGAVTNIELYAMGNRLGCDVLANCGGEEGCGGNGAGTVTGCDIYCSDTKTEIKCPGSTPE